MATDLLLEIAGQRACRNLWRQLGLPIRLPTPLRRDASRWSPRLLADVAFGIDGASTPLTEALRQSIEKMGGRAFVEGTAAKPTACVVNAEAVRTVAQLEALFLSLQSWTRRLAQNGRVVMITRRPGRDTNAEHHAAAAALSGLVRSLAKEVGARAITANLIELQTQSAGEELATLLPFLLSNHASFITGQVLSLSTVCAPPPTKPVSECLHEGRIALVTGAARGLGEATARALAREGAKVVGVDRPESAPVLEALAKEIGGVAAPIDITKADAPAQIADRIAALGGVDRVIHNAGITRDRTFAKLQTEDWRLTLDVNLGSVMRLDGALDPWLRRGARCVLVSSVSGIAGNFGQTNYAASKAGLIGYVRARARALCDAGVAVSAVAPGFIETPMTNKMPFFARESGRRMSALNQGGEPLDVANLINFLASDGAYALSGEVVRVCGGLVLGA